MIINNVEDIKNIYETCLNLVFRFRNDTDQGQIDTDMLQQLVKKINQVMDIRKELRTCDLSIVEQLESYTSNLDVAIINSYVPRYHFTRNAKIGEHFIRGGVSKGDIEATIKAMNELNLVVPVIKSLPINNNGYTFSITYKGVYSTIENSIQDFDIVNTFFDTLHKKLIQNKETLEFAYQQFKSSVVYKLNFAIGKQPGTLNDFTPYRWQSEAYQAWLEQMCKGVIASATGTGKTKFALYCLQEKIRNTQVLTNIIVPTKTLQQQWYSALTEHFNISKKQICRIGGDWKDKITNQLFAIYVDRSAMKYLPKNAEDYYEECSICHKESNQFFIFDECHHYATNTNYKMLECLNTLRKSVNSNVFCLGLSATPERYDGEEKNLYKYIGNVIYRYTVFEALADDVVSPFVVRNVHCYLNHKEKKKYGKYSKKVLHAMKQFSECVSNELRQKYRLGDSNNYIGLAYQLSKRKKGNKSQFETDTFLNGKTKEQQFLLTAACLVYFIEKRKQFLMSTKKRFNKCLQIAHKHCNDKVIIFTEHIEDAEKVYDCLKTVYGTDKVKPYHSGLDDKENMAALSSFRYGSTNILVGVNSLDEGADIKEANIAIIYQHTDNTRQSVQRLGRIIRKDSSPDARKPILYYLHNHDLESLFLKNYFEEFSTESPERVEKMKKGIEKIDFKYWSGSKFVYDFS